MDYALLFGKPIYSEIQHALNAYDEGEEYADQMVYDSLHEVCWRMSIAMRRSKPPTKYDRFLSKLHKRPCVWI